MASMGGTGGVVDFEHRPVKQLIDTEVTVSNDGTFKTVLSVTNGAGIIEYLKWQYSYGYVLITIDGKQVIYTNQMISVNPGAEGASARLYFEDSVKIEIVKHNSNTSAKLRVLARVFK